MSGVVTAIVASAAIGAGVNIYNEDRSRKRQHEAQDKQEAAAKKQLAAEEEAQNKANQREADIEGLLDMPDTSGALGSGTSLTGADGVELDRSTLGKGASLGNGSTLGK